MRRILFLLLGLLLSSVMASSLAYGAESDTEEAFKSLSAKMQGHEFIIETDNYKDEWRVSYYFALQRKTLRINYKEDVRSFDAKNSMTQSSAEGVCFIDLRMIDKERLLVREKIGRLMLFCKEGVECVVKDYSSEYILGEKGKQRSSNKITKKFSSTSFIAEENLLIQLKEALLSSISEL